MKTRDFYGRFVAGIVFVFMFSGLVLAQPGTERRGQQNTCKQGIVKANRLNLSDEQKEKAKDLRIEHLKQVTPIKNELKVKMAELKLASTGDNIDQKKVNSLLDEIGTMKTKLSKIHYADKNSFRKILNEDQKVIFDSMGKERMMRGKAFRTRHGRMGKFNNPQCPRNKMKSRWQNNDAQSGENPS